MACELTALCFDANDPERLARFWGGVLGRESVDGTVLLPHDETGFRLRFVPNQDPKHGPNQMHFDLTSSSLAAQEATVARVLALGGCHLDIGQGADADHVVMADPEGNEFCVIEPGNNFLADTGVIGALSSDGLQEVGYFWSRALDWPLVWDQDGETAIQSPRGGSKITWGGPPLNPPHDRNRLRLQVSALGDPDPEIARLVALGATRLATRSDGVELADPGGNALLVSA